MLQNYNVITKLKGLHRYLVRIQVSDVPEFTCTSVSLSQRSGFVFSLSFNLEQFLGFVFHDGSGQWSCGPVLLFSHVLSPFLGFVAFETPGVTSGPD